MKTQQTEQVVSQEPVLELKAERVQEEISASPLQIEEPFQISLKAERVQEPAALFGTATFAYEMSFNRMKEVAIELIEPRIVVTFLATGGQEAA